jgi:EpsI family protein
MTPRFWSAILLLSATAVLLHARPNADRNPASQSLAEFPNTIEGLTGTDQAIDQQTLDVLGSGDFLSRLYTGPQAGPPISLFIGYFPTQRTGQTIHSPKHCLPGAGWRFDSSDSVTLTDVDHQPVRVGEYVVSNSEQKAFVIYWYQAHGRSVADEYMAKVYLVADAIRMNRTDGALVRVITPVHSGETVDIAKARAERFTAQFAPLLPRYIPD